MNVRPGTTPAQYDNVMRYRVKVHFTDQGQEFEISTPGAEDVIAGYGIADSVAQVVWQRPYASDIPADQLLLRYAGANAGCACIYGGTDQQFDHYIGMDCSKLPISAWRKFGNHRDTYTTAQGLYNRAASGTYTMLVNDAQAKPCTTRPCPCR